MCGRYRLSRRKQIIEEHFDCDSWDYDWNPRFNIAPTQPVPVIRQLGKGAVDRDQHAQCEIRDSRHEARVPRSPEIP